MAIVVGATLHFASSRAWAACTPAAPADGATVSCTGVPILLPPNPNSFLSNANNLNVTVQAGAIMSTLPGGTAMTFGGTGLTLNNLGSIDANAAGSLVLARALAIGNLVTPASGNVTLNNQGSIEGSFDGTFGLAGTAMTIANSGSTTITNSGSIGMAALGLFDPVNAIAVAVYGGGNVNFTNTGTITGRVAFDSPASGGNVFVNAGTINGSVSLGTTLSNDTFVAVTGSSVGNPLIPLPPVTIPTPTVPPGFLIFAATGTADAGIGGTDTLVLQNTVAGPGSGTGGTGTISSLQYLNFENLTVNSGTWTLNGAVISGSATLNGGLSIFDNALAFGTGTLTANGGAIQAALSGLTLTQNVNLAGGLIVQGPNALTLDGTVSGAGGLIKNGSGTLSLLGNNNFSGGLALNAGELTLGLASSLGTGLFLVGGPATLNTAFTGTLGNQVQLNGTLTLNTSGDLTLSGNIAGGGALIVGAGPLSLTGSNSYGGGTLLQAGTLNLGNSSALGTGALTVSGAGANLTASTAVSLGNDMVLNSTLNLGVGSGFSFNGVISGTGALNLVGAPSVALNRVNTFIGGMNIGGGALIVGSNNALGTGAVTVSGATSLDASASASLPNAFTLNAGLAIGGTQDLALSGLIGGAGGITKNGAAMLTLGGANAFAGGVDLRAGELRLGTNTSLGLGALTVNGASTLSAGAGINIGNAVVLNADLAVGGANDITLAGAISGSGALHKQGTGVLTLSGSNASASAVTVSGGTLRAGSAAGLARNAAYTIDGGTLDLAGFDLAITRLSGSGGTLALGSAELTANQTADSGYAGRITGSGQLVKTGGGTLTLSGASDYTGGTALKQGRLNVGNSSALGTGELAMDDGTVLGFASDGLTLANNIRMTGANDPVIDTGSFSATLSGAITGAGFLTKQGSGVLTLTGANAYTGATDVTAGTLRAGAPGTFSSASATSVAAGATLDLAGFNQALASVSNSGTVSLPAAAPGTTLTVNGPWVGNGGTLRLGTALGANSSVTDRLLLNGPTAVASGNTTVQITNLGGLGGLTTGSGIEIIGTAGGASIQPNAFTLAGGHVDAGAYEYRLVTTGAAGYLRSHTDPQAPDAPPPPAVPDAPIAPPGGVVTYRAEVPLFAALPEQLRQSGLVMLANLHQRVGDESSAAAGLGGRQAWGRVISTERRIAQRGTVSPSSRGGLNGFQAGTDLWADWGWRAGVYAGQLDGDMGVRGFARGWVDYAAGSNDLRSQYLGAYATYKSADGFYADAVLQAGRHRYTVSPSLNLPGKGKGDSVLASIELGRSFQIAPGWQLEPQLQLVHQRLGLDDVGIVGATVEQDEHDGWLLRAGLRLHGELSTGAGTLKPYARVNVYRSASGADRTRFIGPAAFTDIASRSGGMSTELATGATLQLSPSTSVYGEVAQLWDSGGDARSSGGLNGSIGIKMRW